MSKELSTYARLLTKITRRISMPPKTDPQGYLLNLSDWTPEVARTIAEREQIELIEQHWQLILWVRDFYQQYHIAPAIRVLVKALKETYGPEIGSSLYLQTLFPKGAAKQLSKIAGLPKPTHCT